MTTAETNQYKSDLVARIFKVFSVLHGFSPNKIFLMIYHSPFYWRLTENLDDMYGYATYWAYYQIAEYHGIQPKKPVEAYRSGYDYYRLHALTLLFEELRSEYEIASGFLCSSFTRLDIFNKMLNGFVTTDEAYKALKEDIEKHRDFYHLK